MALGREPSEQTEAIYHSRSDWGDLTCRELVSLVTDYLDDALGPAERARFEHHLSICDGCRDHLDQMHTTLTLTGRLKEEDVPAAAMEKLRTAFRSWRQGG